MYLCNGNGYSSPVAYVKTNGVWSPYYISRDYLGSITHLYNRSGSLVQELSYDAWGRLRNPLTNAVYSPDSEPAPFLNRGYTGHEHLTAFGLIHMNARAYDPAVGRFLSPDPYVVDPDFTQAYNRYSYCMNNPLVYTDPTGEYAIIDDAIAFLVGGSVNLGVNLVQGNIDNIGEGLAVFGAGGAAGTLALYGPAGWTAGGAIVGGVNAWANGAKGWDIAKSAGIGMVSGLVGGAAGSWAAQGLGGVVINGFNVTNVVLKGAICGALGGAAGGYAGGFTAGLLMTGDFSAASTAGLSSMWSGAALGGTTGSIGAYAYAKAHDINIRTGIRNNRAFFSGEGTEARAIEQGYQTLGQTRAGKNLQNLITSKNIPWSQAEPMWQRLSATWAKGIPNGSTVTVFLNNPRPGSVWFQTELPILQSKGVNIIYK